MIIQKNPPSAEAALFTQRFSLHGVSVAEYEGILQAVGDRRLRHTFYKGGCARARTLPPPEKAEEIVKSSPAWGCPVSAVPSNACPSYGSVSFNMFSPDTAMYFKITPEIARLIREIFTDGDFISEADALLAALRVYRREQLAASADQASQLDAPQPAGYDEGLIRKFCDKILQDAQRRPGGPDS